MTSNLTRLANELFPLLVTKFDGAGLLSNTPGSGGGGTLIQHALNGSYHSGTLSDAQAPQFLKRDGSRSLTGNLSVANGVTVDGVDISVFKGLYDGHLIGDSHGVYAHAEGAGTRPAAYANRLNKNVNTTVGSGLLGGGTLTGSLNLSIDFANATPPTVGLSGSVGVVAQAAREDHTHALDVSISPTWTGLHTFNNVTTHQGGIFLGFGDAIQFGSASAILYASGSDTDLLKTDNHFRVGGLLGVNVDPLYRMHVKAGATNETLLVLENLGTTSQMVFDVGTAFNGVTSTPRVGSSNYASQTVGWRVDNEGGADFRYLFADELHVRAFIADIERALAGGQIITKSVAILTRDFTVPAVGFTAFLYVEDLPGFPNTQVFASGDYVRLRVIDRTGGGLAILDAWGSVTSYQDNTAYGGPDKEQRWTFTTEHTSTGAAVGKIAPKEGLALDYGHPSTGGGYLEALAYGLHTPYYQIVTWVTNPWTGGNLTVQGRYGNINGITDANLNPNGFGFYTKNGFLDGTIYARAGRILNNVLIGGGTVTAQQAAGWAWGSDATYIDGGQIFTGTVNASKLNVGLGGGNLIHGANWNDDPVGGALVMPDAWGRAFYGTVNYHRLTKDTTGSVTGTQGEHYIEASAASGSAAGMQSELVYIDTTRIYTLSAYAKRLSGTGTTSIGVECYNSSGSLLGYRFCTLQAMAATGASGLVSSGGYRYSGTISGTGSSQNEFIAGTHYVKIFFWVVESASGSSSVAVWQVQFEEGDMPTAWAPGLRGNIQIDNQMIIAGTPGAQRTTIEAGGLKGYSSLNALQVHLDSSDGKLKAGGGKVELSAEGFALRTTASDSAFFLFKDGTNATNIGTMYVYKRVSPSTKTMGALTVARSAVSTAAELNISVDSNVSAIALLLDGAANSGAGEIQVLGQFRVGSTQHSFLTGGLNVGSSTGAGTGDVKASGVGDFSAAGIRTRVTSSIPTGGTSGDMAIYSNLGTHRFYCNVAGTWRYATLT